MPENPKPGVFVEEISTRPKPIEEVGTSTAGFVGPTERGPQYPKFIESWLEFKRWFGDLLPVKDSYMPFAIQGFFQNGGQRCYVARVTSGNAPAKTTIGDLNIVAVGKGAWGTRVRVKLSKVEQDSGSASYSVALIYYSRERDPGADGFVNPLDPDRVADPDRVEPDHVELYNDLSIADGVSNNIVHKLNSSSQLVRAYWPDEIARAVEDVAEFKNLDGDAEEEEALTLAHYEGGEGPILPAEPLNDLLGQGSGLTGLSQIDEISILLAPDEVRVANLTAAVVEQCERLKDRFAIVSEGKGKSDPRTINVVKDTTYAGQYYPWIKVFDSVRNKNELVPPSGHVAGIFARTDVERGVHKAPANEVVIGSIDLELNVTKQLQSQLNPKGINCIRDFRGAGRGIRLWGARTMSSDPEWKYINVRRLLIFMEESIVKGTQWVVFEPNVAPTWANVVRSVTNFLVTIWKNGALEGRTQDEAFFVKCDRTTMTQEDIDNGRLICYIGVAPVKPAEFVIFRINQKTLAATA